MIQKPAEDLIDAIHRVRREISALFDGNLVAIAEDAARRQALSGRPVWHPKRKIEVRAYPDSIQEVNSATCTLTTRLLIDRSDFEDEFS